MEIKLVSLICLQYRRMGRRMSPPFLATKIDNKNETLLQIRHSLSHDTIQCAVMTQMISNLVFLASLRHYRRGNNSFRVFNSFVSLFLSIACLVPPSVDTSFRFSIRFKEEEEEKTFVR